MASKWNEFWRGDTMYEDYRKKSVLFQSDEVWNEIVRLRNDLEIVLDRISDDHFILADGFDPFRIFSFGKLDNKWGYSSLDYWYVKEDIASEVEKEYFERLVEALNNNEN